MYNLRLVVMLILLVIGIGTYAYAETISQDDFLDRLKQNHPLFEREKLTAQIEQQRRDSYLGSQDLSVLSSVFYSHDEPSFAVAGPEKTDRVSITSGLEKAFWSTGGRLTASFASNYASLTSDPVFGLPESYFEDRVAVTYSHPLLRNKGGRLDRLQYELSQFDIDLSEEIALENEEIFLAQSASKFLDWVFLIEQHRIVVERLHLAEEELNRTREKRASNLIDEVDLIRAEDAVRIARQNLLLIDSQSNALRSELAVLMQDSSLNQMIPEYNLYDTSALPTLSETTAQLQKDSRLLRALTIRIDQQKLVRSGFQDQGKADLSLVAEIGLKNGEVSYGRALAMDIPEARVGLQLGFPVGNRAVKANLARTELTAMQLEKQLEHLTLELSSAVANLLTQASELETVLQLNIEQIESARRRTAEELKLYDRGRGELTFVIQSQDSEQAAKLTYAVNAVTYHKVLLKLSELTDQLYKKPVTME